MKIRLASLKEGLNPVEESIDAVDLEMDQKIYPFPVHINGSIENNTHMLRLRLAVETTSVSDCDRCAVEFERDIELDLEIHALRREPRDQDEAETDGLLFIGKMDSEIDISAQIREEILLDVPMKDLCMDDCKGLCVHCGVDLNETTCQCTQEES